MAKLTPITVTGETSVTATIYCQQIVVFEVGGGSTAAYTVKEPSGTTGASVGAGQQYNFVAQTGYKYAPGQVVGTLTPASGTLNMAMVEA
jgi:hypothetical protein